MHGLKDDLGFPQCAGAVDGSHIPDFDMPNK